MVRVAEKAGCAGGAPDVFQRHVFSKDCKRVVSYGQCCVSPVGLGIKIRGSTSRRLPPIQPLCTDIHYLPMSFYIIRVVNEWFLQTLRFVGRSGKDRLRQGKTCVRQRLLHRETGVD